MKHFILAGITVACAACHTASKRIGSASMEAVPPVQHAPVPSDKSVVEADVRIDYIAPHAREELAKPEYPASVLAAGGRSYVVYATITLDEAGRVTDVSRSMDRVSLPSEYSDAFFEAVRQAVSKWNIEPAVQVCWQKVPGGDDRYLRSEGVSDRFEMKFTFEASGKVR